MDENQFMAFGTMEQISMVDKAFMERIPEPIRERLSLNEGDTVAMHIEKNMPLSPEFYENNLTAPTLLIRKVNRVGVKISAEHYHKLNKYAQGDEDQIELAINQAIVDYFARYEK